MTLHELYDTAQKAGFEAFYCNGNQGVLVYAPGEEGWCVNAYSTHEMYIADSPVAKHHTTKTVLSWGKTKHIDYTNMKPIDFENKLYQILNDLTYARKQIQLRKNLNQIQKDFK